MSPPAPHAASGHPGDRHPSSAVARSSTRLAGVRRFLTLSVAGLLGLALAVGVTMAASHLTNEDIGLDSEPLTAGRALAPPEVRTAPRTRTKATRTQTTPARTATAPPPVTTTQQAAPPVTTTGSSGRSGDADGDLDDRGGSSGGDHDGDDD